MGWRRNIFTGELEEFESPEGGREVIFRSEVKYDPGRADSPWSRDLISHGMAVHPSQVAQFNEDAKRHGTGAFYRPDGTAAFSTRRSRALEARRRGMFDKDAGYKDYAGR